MATGFLLVCLLAGLLVPKARGLGAVAVAAAVAEPAGEVAAPEAARG